MDDDATNNATLTPEAVKALRDYAVMGAHFTEAVDRAVQIKVEYAAAKAHEEACRRDLTDAVRVLAEELGGLDGSPDGGSDGQHKTEDDR